MMIIVKLNFNAVPVGFHTYFSWINTHKQLDKISNETDIHSCKNFELVLTLWINNFKKNLHHRRSSTGDNLPPPFNTQKSNKSSFVFVAVTVIIIIIISLLHSECCAVSFGILSIFYIYVCKNAQNKRFEILLFEMTAWQLINV